MPLSHSRLTKAKKKEDVLPVFKCSKLKKSTSAGLSVLLKTPSTPQDALLRSFKYTIYTCDNCTVEGGEEATYHDCVLPPTEHSNHRGVCWGIFNMLCVLLKSGESRAGVGRMRDVESASKARGS